MNSNKILSSDVLDILFDKRNKQYGAYILRKFYPNRVKTSLFIMLGMATVFSAFTLLPESKVTNCPISSGEDFIVKEYKDRQPEEQPKHDQPSAPKESIKKFTSKIQVVDSTEKTDSLYDITKSQIGTVTNIIDDGKEPGDDFPGPGTGIVDASPPAPAEPEVDITKPVNNPDVQPSYPGGEEALIKFLQRNLLSPEEMDEGAEVQVRIKFVVGFDGNLQAFDIVKDGGGSFNDEVIRVLKKMPRWNPGKKGGRNVPAYYTLPVKFAAD